MLYQYFTGSLSASGFFAAFVSLVGPGGTFQFFLNTVDNIRIALSSPTIGEILMIIPNFAMAVASFWPIGAIIANSYTIAQLM